MIMCDAEAVAWYVGNSVTLQIGTDDAPLTDADSGAVITGATASGRLVDAAGVEVVPSLELAHAGGGVYRGIAAYDAPVVPGESYFAELTADYAGARWFARVPVTATYRTA